MCLSHSDSGIVLASLGDGKCDVKYFNRELNIPIQSHQYNVMLCKIDVNYGVDARKELKTLL